MSKIRFTNQWSSHETYTISEKDTDDFDHIIQYHDMFDDNGEYLSEFMRELDDCLTNWNPEKFVELYETIDQDNWYVSLY